MLYFTNEGLNGGSSLREITSFQLMCLKKLCFVISSASSEPEPNLCTTCLCKKTTKSIVFCFKII